MNLDDPPIPDKPPTRRCLACEAARTVGCAYGDTLEIRWFCVSCLPEEFQWIDKKLLKIQAPR